MLKSQASHATIHSFMLQQKALLAFENSDLILGKMKAKRKKMIAHSETSWKNEKNPILQSKLNMAFMQISTIEFYPSSLEKMLFSSDLCYKWIFAATTFSFCLKWKSFICNLHRFSMNDWYLSHVSDIKRIFHIGCIIYLIYIIFLSKIPTFDLFFKVYRVPEYVYWADPLEKSKLRNSCLFTGVRWENGWGKWVQAISWHAIGAGVNRE